MAWVAGHWANLKRKTITACQLAVQFSQVVIQTVILAGKAPQAESARWRARFSDWRTALPDLMCRLVPPPRFSRARATWFLGAGMKPPSFTKHAAWFPLQTHRIYFVGAPVSTNCDEPFLHGPLDCLKIYFPGKEKFDQIEKIHIDPFSIWSVEK
jgi:hypothetical protein